MPFGFILASGTPMYITARIADSAALSLQIAVFYPSYRTDVEVIVLVL